MRSQRALSLVLAALATLAASGCITFPTLVKIADVIPASAGGQARETAFPIEIQRFSDERVDRNVLGYKALGRTPISADGDISAAVEKHIARIFEAKGMPRGASPIMLRGTIQQLTVGTIPLTSAVLAEVTIQLTLVNGATRAQIWQRSYGGTSSTGDYTAALGDAFRQMSSALERDDSMLAAKQYYAPSAIAAVKAPARPAAAVEPRPVEITSDVDGPPRKAAAVRPDDFALVIGIEKYQSVPPALYAERDAATFKRYAIATLGVPEENVIYLTGQRATRTGIAKYLEEWLPKNVDEKSRVYVYFSGHGAPDPVRGHAYLIPWDGDPSFLESTAYPVSKLYENLQKLKAKQVIVALDSCFSGAGGRSVLARGARPLVTVAETALPPDTKLSVLTASLGEEIAGSLDEQGHGLFTYYLLKGLKGDAADASGHVTLTSLHSYISQSVKRAARRQNREQTPQLKAADGSLRIY